MELKFDKWKDVLWIMDGNTPIAYCPNHKHRLEIFNKYSKTLSQDTSVGDHVSLLCPVDNTYFKLDG